MDTLETQYIDAIMGSQELLLYDIHDALLFIPTAKDWEQQSLAGVFKSDLVKKLNVSPEMFMDALLMIGTSFLPSFPPLEDPDIIRAQPFNIGDAINLLRTSEKSVTSTCTAFSDILQLRDPSWLDKYRKAKMSVKHCVTVHENGRVLVKDYEHLTGDNVEYMGLQLPPELYHYLASAVVGPRLMNTFQSLESVFIPTLDGVLSDEYRKLTTQSLTPLKELTAGLITSRIHRVFLHRPISLRTWFDDGLKIPLNHRAVGPTTNKLVDTWGMRRKDLEAREKSTGALAGSLSFALLALESDTPLDKAGSVSGLSLDNEVLPNALWRLLHLRGYIDDAHRLTAWGKALATSYKSLGSLLNKQEDVQHVQEAAFLAFELLRFDNLHGRNRHAELIGGSLRGSDDDKASCILIGRAACLLKIRHKSIGYTGPLSKNLLHYYSIAKAVRETDRDLLEAIIASMLLSGQAARTDGRLSDLGHR